MSSENDILDGFNEFSDDSLEKILANLMDSEKDIELKTEIIDVPSISVLKVLAEYFKEKKLVKSSELLENYLKHYLKYMVSSSRKGRLEIIDAVKGMANWRFSAREKMTNDLKEM